MDAIKAALINFHASLGENDKLILISFGQYIDMMLDGSETPEVIHEKINSLVANEDFTQLYGAIDEAVTHSAASRADFPRRAAAIAISDGMNDADLGEGKTLDEALRRLGEGRLPLYALGFEDAQGTEEHRVGMEKFSELANESDGYLSTITADNISDRLAGVRNHINSGKLLRLKADTNHASGQQETLLLTVTFGSKSIQAKDFTLTVAEHIPDNEAPTVLSATQVNDTKIEVTFSEPVIGATSVSSYVVKDESGKQLALQSVQYTEDSSLKEGNYKTTITFDEKPYEGKYTVEFFGITDYSMEANAVAEPATIDLSGDAIFIKILRIIFFDFWWVILLVVILVVAFVIYRVIRKRKGLIKVNGEIGFGDVAEFKHHFKTPDAKPICLIVTDMKGKATRVELDVSSSIFVGRSKINNLSFDDTKMSRQHFVIEAEDNDFYISDLNTTNGTFINGVELTDKRRLEEGDVITAGHEKFVFRNISTGTNG